MEMTYRGDVIKDAAAYKNAQFYDLAKSHLSLSKNKLYIWIYLSYKILKLLCTFIFFKKPFKSNIIFDWLFFLQKNLIAL
jgi:hypothetical protein